MHTPTIFLDIDGTILKHNGSLSSVYLSTEVLDGVLEKLNEWERIGCRIVLTTGRKESQRKYTELQLEKLGIFYDYLIMGIGGGPRVLINDKKSTDSLTAYAINVDRNVGIKDIDLAKLIN